MGPFTNILYTQAHKLSWALSQILSIIANILSNLGFHKICSSYYYQNWAVNYTIPTQSPISFGLWEKLKESPNSKSPTMMWLIPKSHYDVANSKKSHYDVANSKKSHYDVANSKESHYDVANSKARYDAALFTKPITAQHYLQKPL